MRSTFVLLVTLLSPTAVHAIRCGTWATEPCIGDQDVRYDPDVSSHLADLDPLYGNLEGLWVGDVTAFGRDKMPLGPEFATPQSASNLFALPYRSVDTRAFINITLRGTRWYQHDLYVYAPADDLAICKAQGPPGTRNVLDNGVCGTNGYAAASNVFRTSTHEKDGVSVFVSGSGLYSAASGADGVTARNIGNPVGGQVMYSGYESFESFSFSSQTIVMSSDFNSMYITTAVYLLIRGRPIFLNSETVGTLRRTTEEEFIGSIQDAFTKNNVTKTTQSQFTFPLEDGSCPGKPCPTEEDWCSTDPDCTESPYQENPRVKGGVIAGFAILGTVVVVTAIVFFYQWKLRRVKRKAKAKFSTRMAKSMHFMVASESFGSNNAVSPEELVEEFNKISKREDGQSDGLITKQALWDFVTSKDGDMTEKEFDVLFSTVDKDKSGAIDFAEFCAFVCELNQKEKRLF